MGRKPEQTFDDLIRRNGERVVEEGQRIFRFDTFGDGAFWGDTLKLHQAIEGTRSSRSPDRRYRTTPLAGLFTRQKGGFYHDGRFADLRAVIERYNQVLNLNLGEQEKKDLVEYLKSF